MSVSCHVPPASSSADLQQSRRPATDWSGLALKVLLPMAGVVVALAMGAIMLVVLKADPIAAYAALVRGAVGSRFGLTQTLVKATPLLLVGLGICIAFRANVINIGGEGQIIAGALMAAWFPLTFPSWPGWLLIPSTMIVGFLAGSIWGFVPGFLKARLRVNEILSTIMMNSIALQLMNLLLQGPLMDPAGVKARTFLAQSAQLPAQVWLPRLVPRTLLHAGAIVAVVLAVVVYIFLWRTTIGYNIRAVGLNPQRLPVRRHQRAHLPGALPDAGRRIRRARRGAGGDRCAAPIAGGAYQRLRIHRDRGCPARQPASAGPDPGLDSLRRTARGRGHHAARGPGPVLIWWSRFSALSCCSSPARRSGRGSGRPGRGRSRTHEEPLLPHRRVGNPQYNGQPCHSFSVCGPWRDDCAELRRGEPRRGRNHAAQRFRGLLRRLDHGEPVAGSPGRRDRRAA